MAIETVPYHVVEMELIPVGTMPDLRRVNIANGKQARVVRIADYPGAERPCVAKYCGGEHKGYTFDEVQSLIAETKGYYKDLVDAGVRVPKNHRIQPVQVEADNSWQIVMVDEMEGDGEDLKQKLQNGYSPEHKKWVMLKILEFLDKLPDGEVNNNLITCPTGVLGDFKPDNWVLNGEEMVLIDYFGPKRWKDGQTYPYLPKMDSLLTREAITFLCGDRRGQFGRIMAMAKRTFPETYEYTADIGLALLKHNHPEAYPWVKEEVENGFQRIDMIYQVRPEFWTDKV